jgi:hypothetical protein
LTYFLRLRRRPSPPELAVVPPAPSASLAPLPSLVAWRHPSQAVPVGPSGQHLVEQGLVGQLPRQQPKARQYWLRIFPG